MDSRALEPGYVGWLTFNVSSAADLWRMFPESNLGLFMEVSDAVLWGPVAAVYVKEGPEHGWSFSQEGWRGKRF